MLVGVACGAAEEATPTPTSPPSATSTPTRAVPPTATPTTGPQPKRGGILREHASQDPNTYNAIDTASGGTNSHLNKVFNNLIWNPEGNVLEPDAAESYKISGDGKTWTFVLRNNVKWHAGTPAGPRDGTLMTAKDAEYSLEKMMGLVDGIVSPRCGWMKEFVDTSRPDKGVVAMDDRTLEVHMAHPTSALGMILATGFCAIVPDGTTREMMNSRTYGAGAFVIKSFQRGALWIYARNEQYFKPGLPYLDEVHGIVIRDVAVAQSAFLTGNLDLDVGWPSPDNKPLFQKLQDQGTIKHRPVSGYCYPQGVFFNATKPPFDNLKLRQAVNLGLERQGYIEVMHFGNAEDQLIMGGGWGRSAAEISQMPGHRQPHDADFAEAQRIIKEEYPKGLSLTMPVERSTGYMRQGEYIAGDLAKLGITVTAELMESAQWDAMAEALNYTVAPYYFCQVTLTPEELFGSYFLTGGSRNWIGYSNPKVDAAYLDMAGTVDPIEKKGKIRAMEDIIMADMIMAPLPVQTTARFFYSYVHDVPVAISPYNHNRLERVWKE